MNTEAKPTGKITADEVAEYVRYADEKKELERKARTLGGEMKRLAEHFGEVLKDREQTECKRGEHVVALVTKQGSVSWKNEFVKVSGPDKAAELQAEAPTKTTVEIRKAK